MLRQLRMAAMAAEPPPAAGHGCQAGMALHLLATMGVQAVRGARSTDPPAPLRLPPSSTTACRRLVPQILVLLGTHGAAALQGVRQAAVVVAAGRAR